MKIHYWVGLTDENLFDLMRSIDVDGNGKIDEQVKFRGNFEKNLFCSRSF